MTFEKWAAIQGFTAEDLAGPLHELEGCWRAAQKAEREACSKVIEGMLTETGWIGKKDAIRKLLESYNA